MNGEILVFVSCGLQSPVFYRLDQPGFHGILVFEVLVSGAVAVKIYKPSNEEDGGKGELEGHLGPKPILNAAHLTNDRTQPSPTKGT